MRKLEDCRSSTNHSKVSEKKGWRKQISSLDYMKMILVEGAKEEENSVKAIKSQLTRDKRNDK